MRKQDFIQSKLEETKFRVYSSGELVTTQEEVDDYAIKFANWYEFTLRESDNLNERFTPKQLIEMFKKEKGL